MDRALGAHWTFKWRIVLLQHDWAAHQAGRTGSNCVGSLSCGQSDAEQREPLHSPTIYELARVRNGPEADGRLLGRPALAY
jgi:hypothetical protein